MRLKRNKTERKYCVHYDIERINDAQLTEKFGKVQYRITVKYFVGRANLLANSNTMKTERINVSGNRVFKKIAAIDKNILNTKKEIIAELKHIGASDDMLTEIMRIKGFGHEGK